jgi:hypothetical protein
MFEDDGKARMLPLPPNTSVPKTELKITPRIIRQQIFEKTNTGIDKSPSESGLRREWHIVLLGTATWLQSVRENSVSGDPGNEMLDHPAPQRRTSLAQRSQRWEKWKK